MQMPLEPALSPKEGQLIWSEILQEAKNQNLTAPTVVRSLAKLSFLTLCFAIALVFAWVTTNPLALGLALLILSILMSQFAFLGHDAGHGTISRSTLTNRLFGQFSMTLIAGMCFDAWFRTHKTHHQFCQNEDKDPDMAVSTVVSLTHKSSLNKSRVGRFFTQYQHVHIWFLSLFFAHSQRHLTQWDAIRWRCFLDGFVTFFHLCIWILIPLYLDVSLTRILLVYFVPAFILGPHLAAIFWVNHIGMPVVERQERFSFLEHQALTSRTVSIPQGTHWLFGGLDYQVEHHLLSQVPSHRLKDLQKIVIPAFKQHRVPYAGKGWWETIRDIKTHLSSIARGETLEKGESCKMA